MNLAVSLIAETTLPSREFLLNWVFEIPGTTQDIILVPGSHFFFFWKKLFQSNGEPTEWKTEPGVLWTMIMEERWTESGGHQANPANAGTFLV